MASQQKKIEIQRERKKMRQKYRQADIILDCKATGQTNGEQTAKHKQGSKIFVLNYYRHFSYLFLLAVSMREKSSLSNGANQIKNLQEKI